MKVPKAGPYTKYRYFSLNQAMKWTGNLSELQPYHTIATFAQIGLRWYSIQ